jgi:hypothetical protein
MTQTQTLGHQPAIRRLVLIDGQDFTDVFTTVGDPLPDGTVVALEILNRDRTYTYGSWPVTETEDGWVPFIDAADHVGIPHGAWFRLYTTYPSGGGRHCWIAGPVERNRR